MQLKFFTDYGLRVLLYVAANDGRLVTIDEISRSYGISHEHLRKIVHKLAQSEFLATRRGKDGGMSLARPASEIRPGDVIEALEDVRTIIDCDRDPCPLRGVCRLRTALDDARDAFIDTMNKHTLADLVGGETGAKLSELQPAE
ncbi:Rrf2 family transcriptional regulator [Ferruginivarius sediminum]|uniref:Rrf2 family transcriptional regulator n=1 Tax=Ferruginivarius sediminum TaxID=2661937 RepID=A0A369TAS4_9PROT|nr:Rrf2 family transcriptional regulator [Ferruginivarius sediminum]RDD62390.1 Rrf2 family transcriptional regulator [Ferruginivarius sediminum]